MINTEEYKAIISDLMDELPGELFRELTGGVIMSEALVIPDYAKGNDLYTLGQYQVCYGLRQIVMFKGSFDRLYPQAGVSEARSILRGVLRHEFRHHIEFLGGIHNSSSLEAQDARQKQDYLAQHKEKEYNRTEELSQAAECEVGITPVS